MSLLYFLRFLTPLRRSWTRTLLSLLGITFGVTGYGAVRTSNYSILESVRAKSDLLRADCDYTIRANREIPEELIPKLLPLSQKLCPRIIKYTGDPLIEVIGVDLLQGRNLQLDRTDAISLLSGESAAISALTESEITIEGKKLRIISSDSQTLNRTVVVDIALAQELFGQYGSVDELGFSSDNIEAVRKLLPEGFEIEKSDSLAETLLYASKALRLNLNFMASLSFLVAALLIFSSASFSLLQRREDLGILRAIGVPERFLLKALIAEAAILGFIGAATGVWLSYLLSDHLVGELARTISALYLPTAAARADFSLGITAELILLGITVSVLGTVFPARSELRSSIASLLNILPRKKSVSSLPLWLGLSLLVIGALTTQLPVLNLSLLFGFLPPTLIIFGWILLTPSLSHRLLGMLRGVTTPIVQIPLSLLGSSPSRLYATVSAVSLALALFLGVSTLIGSFRLTVESWLSEVLTADIYISAPLHLPRAAISAKLIDGVSSLADVARVEVVRNKKIILEGRPVTVTGLSLRSLEGIRVLKKLGSLADGALVSESFVRRFGERRNLELGASIPVAGVFTDYSSDSGVIYLSDKTFFRLFGEVSPQGVSLFLKEGASAATLIESIQSNSRELPVSVRDQQGLRAEVFKVFDQTFAVTRILQSIALAISLFVIINTILMLRIERGREIGSLWAMGVSRRSLTLMTCSESGLLGLIGGISGVLLGLILSLVLVYFVNFFFFGWSIRFHLSPQLVLGTLGLTVLSSFILGALPALLYPPKSEVLRYE